MYITNINKTPFKKTSHRNKIWWLLGKEIGVPNYEMRYFEMPPGNKTTPGSHPWEHEVFVVKGKGIVKGNNEEYTLRIGDAIYIAPNEHHQFINNGETTFGFICVIPKGYER